LTAQNLEFFEFEEFQNKFKKNKNKNKKYIYRSSDTIYFSTKIFWFSSVNLTNFTNNFLEFKKFPISVTELFLLFNFKNLHWYHHLLQ
jgi:hypothetical protein